MRIREECLDFRRGRVKPSERSPGDFKEVTGPLRDLLTNLEDFRRVSEREEHHFADLAARVAPAPVTRVPFLADDVHDLDGLSVIERYLLGS